MGALERTGKKQRGRNRVSKRRWEQQNAHLLSVEQRYYALLKQMTVHREGVRDVEAVIERKEAEIEGLKERVRREERQNGNKRASDDERGRSVAGSNSRSHSAMKLVELKGE